MSINIELPDVQAWVEKTKLGPYFTAIDNPLAEQITNSVLAMLASSFSINTWVGPSSTPSIVKQIIAMKYTAMLYNKVYSEDEELSEYATLLLQKSEDLINGLIAGSVTLIGIGSDTRNSEHSGPGFYPTDTSSSLKPNSDDYSLGGPVFSMGRQW